MFTTALILLLGAAAYFTITTLCDLAPFNNVRGSSRAERLAEMRVNLPMLLLPAILLPLSASLDLPVLAFAGAGIELLVAVAGLSLWWLPYLFNVSVPWAATPGTTWTDIHARTYARTVIVVPRIGSRPRPNLEHMILHSLLLAAGICTVVYAVRS